MYTVHFSNHSIKSSILVISPPKNLSSKSCFLLFHNCFITVITVMPLTPEVIKISLYTLIIHCVLFLIKTTMRRTRCDYSANVSALHFDSSSSCYHGLFWQGVVCGVSVCARRSVVS